MNVSNTADPIAFTSSRWTTTVGKVCDQFGGEVQTGPFGSQLHASDYLDEGTPVVMPQDMQDGKIITDQIARVAPEHVDRLRQHRLQVGDIVYSRRGDVGRFAVVSEVEAGWLCGTGSIRIRLNCPDIDIGYVRRYLQQDVIEKWLRHHAKGVTMPNLNTTVIRALPFVYPPLPEQRRIAEILDKADALRVNRRAALAQLDTLTQSIFLDMFGDPVAYGWRMTTIASVASGADGAIRTGPFGSQLLHSEFTDEGIAVLGIDNAVENEFRWGQRRFISEVKYRGLSRYRVYPGDVLITIMGTCGRCAIVPDDIPTAINTKHLCAITLDRTKCLPIFLHAYFLGHPIALRYLAQKGKGAIMEGLNMGIIKDMPIPFAPIERQVEFARLLKQVSGLKAEQRRSAGDLEKLFASLQHGVFQEEL